MTSRDLVRGATIPNLITLARLFSAPVAVWLVIVDEYMAAFWLFLAAGLSDAIDGLLARLLQARSLLGAYLDPIADKTLLMGVFFALGYNGKLSDWIVMLVVSRDIFILGGAILVQTLKPGSGALSPSLLSKLNTVLQIGLAGLALGFAAFAITATWVVDVLAWVVAATTILSGLGYLREAGRRFGAEQRP
ncbi:MAG TPA: CDP-alcohol phosphatidyltransferase family protein [Alphaproteobacteria bacterium]|nr:CDP-alcohol phosphatidyltransferase family protein [Alphaproteobacteria bacterium]